MMYEYDTYVDARKEFPRLREPLQAMDGEYYLVKNDILAGTMTFSSSKDAMVNVTTLSIARVREIVSPELRRQEGRPLQAAEDIAPAAEEPTYRSEEDSITRFDRSQAPQQAEPRQRGPAERTGSAGSRTTGCRPALISRAGSRNAARGATTVPAMAKAAAVRGATTKAATEIRTPQQRRTP